MEISTLHTIMNKTRLKSHSDLVLVVMFRNFLEHPSVPFYGFPTILIRWSSTFLFWGRMEIVVNQPLPETALNFNKQAEEATRNRDAEELRKSGIK